MNVFRCELYEIFFYQNSSSSHIQSYVEKQLIGFLTSIDKLSLFDISMNLLGVRVKICSQGIVFANRLHNAIKLQCPVFGGSFVSKLVERVVAKQLCYHLYAHGLENSKSISLQSWSLHQNSFTYLWLEVSPLPLYYWTLLQLSTMDHSTLLNCL